MCCALSRGTNAAAGRYSPGSVDRCEEQETAQRGRLEDPAHEVLHSAASLWETAIKPALRTSDFRVDLAVLRSALTAMDFTGLPVSGTHAEMLTGFRQIHKDPFDRMLLAQNLAEQLVLFTNDASLAAYGQAVKVV